MRLIPALWDARHIAAVVVATLAIAESARAGEPATIVLRVMNPAGLPRPTLAAALDVTDSIYRAIGVRLEWTIDDTANSDESAPGHITVTLGSCLTGTILERRLDRVGRSDRVLAITVPGTCRVFVFCGRIDRLSQSLEHFKRTLGRVLAHEIGHVLLGNLHSNAGVMQAQPNYTSRQQPQFTAAEAEVIRARAQSLCPSSPK
jgi:hypothetical protein